MGSRQLGNACTRDSQGETGGYTMLPRIFHVAGGALPIAILAGPATAAPPITGLRAAEPQPTADQLAPGLAVQYTYAIMNHIAEMKGRKFETGPPIMHLDWH